MDKPASLNSRKSSCWAVTNGTNPTNKQLHSLKDEEPEWMSNGDSEIVELADKSFKPKPNLKKFRYVYPNQKGSRKDSPSQQSFPRQRLLKGEQPAATKIGADKEKQLRSENNPAELQEGKVKDEAQTASIQAADHPILSMRSNQTLYVAPHLRGDKKEDMTTMTPAVSASRRVSIPPHLRLVDF